MIGFGSGQVGRAVVEIVGDASKLRSEFQQARSTTESETGRMRKASDTMKAAVVAGMVIAAAAVIKFAADSVRAYKEAALAAAQTVAVIESTGGAAGVTADEVGKLAATIQDYSGISDEAVQAGANMLLTFSNIKDGVGEGNDIFSQSVPLLADMAVRLGKDLPTAAIQMGKALNDPIAGITALSRAGVYFSDENKAMIVSLMEAGDIMEAQKIILAELAFEFGGAARAAGKADGGAKILAQNVNDLQEAFGAVIVTGAKPFVSVLNSMVEGFNTLPGPIKATLTLIMSIGAAALLGVTAFKAAALAAQTLGLSLGAAGGPIGIAITALALLTVGLAEAGSAMEGLSAKFAEDAGTFKTDLVDAFARGEISAEGVREEVARVNGVLDDLHNATGESTTGLKLNANAIIAEGEAAAKAGDENAQLAASHRESAQTARDAARAELELAGGLLGLLAQAETARQANQKVRASQRAVNVAIEEGGRGTDKYRSALRDLKTASADAILAQIGLGSSVQDLKDKSKNAQKDAIADIKAYGKATGVSKGIVNDLIGEVRGLNAEYRLTPHEVATKIHADVSQAIDVLGFFRNLLDSITGTFTTVINTVRVGAAIAGAREAAGYAAGGIVPLAAGGITQAPTLLVGEGTRRTFAGRGAEAIIPLNAEGTAILGEAVAQGLNRSSFWDVLARAGTHSPRSESGGSPMVLEIVVDGERISRSVTVHQGRNRILLSGRE